jgi:hypothetical protein
MPYIRQSQLVSYREVTRDVINGEFTEWLDHELGCYGATIGDDGTLENFRTYIRKRARAGCYSKMVRVAFEDLLDMYIRNQRWREPDDGAAADAQPPTPVN